MLLYLVNRDVWHRSIPRRDTKKGTQSCVPIVIASTIWCVVTYAFSPIFEEAELRVGLRTQANNHPSHAPYFRELRSPNQPNS
jgi:hypothetical protein